MEGESTESGGNMERGAVGEGGETTWREIWKYVAQ